LIVTVSFIKIKFTKNIFTTLQNYAGFRLSDNTKGLRIGWIKLAEESPEVRLYGHGNESRGSIKGIKLTD
jgi:hypothetical protein